MAEKKKLPNPVFVQDVYLNEVRELLDKGLKRIIKELAAIRELLEE